jgi:protein CpxP
VYEEKMTLRRGWKRFCAIGLLNIALLAWAEVLAAQEPSAAPRPSQDETSIGRSAHGNAVEVRLERLSQQLNLTNEQKAKIRPVLRHETERIVQVRSNTSLSQGETQRRIRLIRGDTHQRIGQFLTAEQKKQWQETSQAQRSAPRGGELSSR